MVRTLKYKKKYANDILKLYCKHHELNIRGKENDADQYGEIEEFLELKDIMLLDVNGRIKGYMIYKPHSLSNKSNVVNIPEIYIEKDYDTKSNYITLLNSVKKKLAFKSYDYAKIDIVCDGRESNLVEKLDIKLSKKMLKMKIDLKSREFISDKQSAAFHDFKKGVDEARRAEIQNSIFRGTDGHVDLSVKDILHEEHQDFFLDDGGIFIDVEGNLAGYSQIILEKEPSAKPYIVNFGIMEAYRRKGLGMALLEYTLEKMKSRGFIEAYVTVDGDNLSAYNLYRRLGFKKVHTIGSFLYKYK